MHRENISIEALTRRAIAVFFCSLIGLGACVDRSSEEATAEEALVALNDAELTCGDVVDQALECLTGLQSCVGRASTAGDLDACKAEIEGCVPPPPPPTEGDMPEGDCPKPGSTDGQPPPPPDGSPQPPPDGSPPPSTDGSPPPPPPPPPPNGKRPHHKPIGNPCIPGGPVVTPCLEDLKACLETSTDSPGCFSAAQVCLQTALEEKLAALCDLALARCAETDGSEEACADIAAKCSSTAP
jgi:hypothetical protein